MATSPALARTMRPSKAAEFLRSNFSTEEILSEIQRMLKAGGRMTNLAHGIAVELKLAEHEDLKKPLVASLRMKASDLSVGYGGQAGDNASERSEFAGKGPMFAKMNVSSEPDAAPVDDDENGDAE